LRSDEEQLKSLTAVKTYEDYGKLLGQFVFARLSGKKEEGVSEDKKNRVKAIRDEIKKTISDLVKNYFFQEPEKMFQDMKAMAKPVEVLIRLCREFSEEYAKRKADKNIVDFNDLEHFALKILVEKKDGAINPTPAADELSEYFEEIMIDEYQDSNLVQETILNSISRERYGTPNLFMVGDVKQSIYRFRLARPEIFMEKYDTYSLDEGKYQRIDLHKNFRSRPAVIDSVNFIFEQIMIKHLGGITYDENAALYPGADFGDETDGISKDTEVCLVSVEPAQGQNVPENKKTGTEPDDELPEAEYTAREIEAKAIAKRIKELVDPDKGLKIYDKKEKAYRRACYGDIVILLRTMSGWSEVFSDTLAAEGIPAHAQTQSGYFSTLEIRTVLNLLRIIDNPRQDIPFTAILRSPIVGLTNDELARIRIPRRRILMYDAAIEYMEENSDELSQKLTEFIKKLNHYRDLVHYTPIHELIIKVLEDTGYYDFITAMPSGEKRRANVDMLIKRAIHFENTSYSGLFHFIRYMEKLHRYVDFGEAEVAGESGNTVRIMSVHMSKGLEFPIVFAAGLGKSFNNQDSRSSLLIHPDLGIGIDYVDTALRIKTPTLVKKVIQKELVLENLGEELRILYVAMTRAKEKLILTGGVKDMNKMLTKWSGVLRQKEKPLTFYQLSSASTFLDFIVPALMRYRGMEGILKDLGLRQDEHNPLYHSPANIVIKFYSYEEAAGKEYMAQVDKIANKEDLENWDSKEVYNEEYRKAIQSYMDYEYPYRTETKIHTKVTVSELKRLGQYEADDLIQPVTGNEEKEREYKIPVFAGGEAADGANLGTKYHTVLEAMDLRQMDTVESIRKLLNQLYKKGKLNEADLKALDEKKLYRFTKSNIAKRMRKASDIGKLYKERQFIMGIKASEINSTLKSEELVLVQGIIDAYFEEEGQWVLVDYKTDSVYGDGAEELLIKRYRVQLQYYEKALEQLTGKKVKERIIYSFSLNKEVYL
jgi:ATP-dependent helicase/nuclease subunit A